MRHRIFALAFCLWLSVNTSHGQKVFSQSRGHGEFPCQLSRASSLQSILGVLNGAKLSGSLVVTEFSKPSNYRNIPDVPPLCVAAINPGSPLQTLRTMFDDESTMRVTQDANGIIRMVEHGTQTDILNAKIAHLSFDNRNGGIDNPNAALGIIKASPELQHFLKIHDSNWPFAGNGEAISILADNNMKPVRLPSWVPHISGSMNKVTVREAMDRILKTFPGIWIYENYPSSGTQKRIIYLHFYRLQASVNGTIVE